MTLRVPQGPVPIEQHPMPPLAQTMQSFIVDYDSDANSTVMSSSFPRKQFNRGAFSLSRTD